ncbi:uncharacterized protein C6orf136 homolog isoform X2 [Genypterus blacodes]|uniref:uncharacterized protein C6orf136 homolog isoform X2 n=1 Tax=Genypterus blacodes TaxID=154954 RepID=UPI003F7698B6
MAVSRGGIAFWVGCVRSHGRRLPIKKQQWSLDQTIAWQWISQTRPLSSASWSLAPPNSLRYQNVKQPVLSHPFHHASQPQRSTYYEEEWEDAFSVCVLVLQGEPDSQCTMVEIPLVNQIKIGELLAPVGFRSMQLPFPMTTVDGSREDDISVGIKADCINHADVVKKEHGRFQSLFEDERCPAPFHYGLHFYCFHCPVIELAPGCRLNSRHVIGLLNKPMELPLLLPSSLCSHAEIAGGHPERDKEGEEKLALMYERLRIELPSFFWKNHDYSMYSNDVEFINGLLNTKTRSYDVFSTFYIGHDGLIHCHKVEKVMPAQPPVVPRVRSLLTGILVALGVQEHRPALNLLPLLLSSLRQDRN